MSPGGRARGRWHKAVTSATTNRPEAPSDEGSDRGACEGEQGARADQADGLEHAHACLTCNACATFQKKCAVRDSAELRTTGHRGSGKLSGRTSTVSLEI